MPLNLPQITTDAVTLLDNTLTALEPQIGADNTWSNTIDPMPDYWGNAASPAAACAVYDHIKQGTKWMNRAVNAIESSLTTYGSNVTVEGFGPVGSTDNSIDTMEFGRFVAMTLLLYGDKLDGARRARWLDKLVQGCDYMRAHGNFEYYTNGNIMLGNYSYAKLVGLLSRQQRIHDMAERNWWMLIEPYVVRPGQGWEPYGFKQSAVDPYPWDGSTTSGYFTETGAGGTGLDYDYSQYQLSIMSFIYVLTRDARIPRYMNLLINQIWSRVSLVDVTINTKLGTRHTETTDRFLPYTTSSLGTATQLLGRTDLGADPLTPQFYTVNTANYPGGNNAMQNIFGVQVPVTSSPGLYREVYHDLGIFALMLFWLNNQNMPEPLYRTPSTVERRRYFKALP